MKRFTSFELSLEQINEIMKSRILEIASLTSEVSELLIEQEFRVSKSEVDRARIRRLIDTASDMNRLYKSQV